MIPLTALVTVKQVTGPEIVERYNIFPVGQDCRRPGAGLQLGPGDCRHGRTGRTSVVRRLQPGLDRLGLPGKQTGGASTLVFVFALVMVF